MSLHDVIVVGAGVAGLGAAQELVKAGKSVLMLEAQDYIGGRVKTSYEWGSPIELGAEFIHGANTAIGTLANELELKTTPFQDDRRLFGQDGQTLSSEQRKQFDALRDCVAEHGKSGVSIADIIADNPITHDPILLKLAVNSVGDYEAGDADKLDSGAFSEMERLSADNGANLQLLSGYQKIIDYLAKGVTVRPNSIVKTVDYSDQNVAQVTLASGEVLTAKHVIVTVSLGVLKHGDITFIPELPAKKRAAIGQLGMGNVVKCIMRLREQHDVKGFIFDADDDIEDVQTVSCWWASGSDPRVLIGYAGGSRAAAILKTPRDKLMPILESELHALGIAGDHPEIEDCIVSHWDDNPFVRGAYSNHPVGASLAERSVLAQPVAGKLFFAGEATLADGNYATVHGAIMSGRNAASEIIATL